MPFSKDSERAGPAVNSQSSHSHNSPARRQRLTAALNAPGLDRSFRSAVTRSIALTPDNVWFVDPQWYRKIKQEDLFLKSVHEYFFQELKYPW